MISNIWDKDRLWLRVEQGVRIANQSTIKKITSGRKSHRFASNFTHFLCSLVRKAFIGFRKANSGEMCQNTLKWPIGLRAKGVNLTTGATSMTSTSNYSILNQREVKPRISAQESSGRCLPPRQGVSDGKLKTNKGVLCLLHWYLLKITRKILRKYRSRHPSLDLLGQTESPHFLPVNIDPREPFYTMTSTVSSGPIIECSCGIDTCPRCNLPYL